MDIQAMKTRVVATHAAWLATPEPRYPFKQFLALRAHPEFIEIRKSPDLQAALPKEVRRALKLPRGRRLGPSVLALYAKDLTALWEKDKRGMTHRQFFSHVAEECETEGELREFLGLK